MSLESRIQADLIKDLEVLLPGCLVLKGNSDYVQGVPDLIVLFQDRWAALEVKRSATSPARPNQPYYVDKLDHMGFAAFVFPENREHILDALQNYFGV
jgi:hypothetical protein